MLIDKYLKNFHFNEVHTITISGTPKHIYPIIKNIDFGKSLIIKFLFAIRGLPKEMRNLKGFIDIGFILLEEKKEEEIVLGAVGKPWHSEGGNPKVTPDEFRTFMEKGYVKIIWNFHLSKMNGNRIRVSTETRVYTTDKKSKYIFSLYWFVIAPFSGLIRRIMLRLIKREAEAGY